LASLYVAERRSTPNDWLLILGKRVQNADTR
jgi:hypothetical protein